MVTGGSHCRIKETLGLTGALGMTKASFIDIGKQWKRKLQESMAEAGKEEKRLAKERGEGVPAITVVLDGGWSKRSHKHSFNAKSTIIQCNAKSHVTKSKNDA